MWWCVLDMGCEYGKGGKGNKSRRRCGYHFSSWLHAQGYGTRVEKEETKVEWKYEEKISTKENEEVVCMVITKKEMNSDD
jgi:hypothetical protein